MVDEGTTSVLTLFSFTRFEAFDEPWKIRYNHDDQNWEDKWGLMGIDRNLKHGLKIPDCGGKTVDS